MSQIVKSQEELKSTSDHLCYEIEMMFGTANALAMDLFREGVIFNAVLESFTIHTRNLLHFFFGKRQRDDVMADDFIPDWQQIRLPETELLTQVHHRVGKEIAHLTYSRNEITDEAKQWQFAKIAEEMFWILSNFLYRVSDETLGPKMINLKNSPMGLRILGGITEAGT